MAESIGEARLVIHFKVEERVEIVELSQSFEAIDFLYRDFLRKQKRKNDLDVKLYIAEIRDNCILLQLVQIAQDLKEYSEAIKPVITVMEQFNTFREFTGHLDLVIAYFIGAKKGDIVKPKYSKKKTNAILSLLKIVKRSTGGKLIMRVFNTDKGDSEKPIVDLSPDKISKAVNAAERDLKAFGRTTEGSYKKVSLRFTQANVGKPKRKGHTDFRGIIEEISKTDLPVFMSEDDGNKIKKLMNTGKLDLTPKSYSVDVEVKRNRNGKLQSYEIKKWHKPFSK